MMLNDSVSQADTRNTSIVVSTGASRHRQWPDLLDIWSIIILIPHWTWPGTGPGHNIQAVSWIISSVTESLTELVSMFEFLRWSNSWVRWTPGCCCCNCLENSHLVRNSTARVSLETPSYGILTTCTHCPTHQSSCYSQNVHKIYLTFKQMPW